MQLTYQYEGYAGFHVLQLHTERAPVLLFCAPNELPHMTRRELCDAGRLGNLEANVMAGRALLGVFYLPDAQCRCVLLLVQEKVLQGGTTREALLSKAGFEKVFRTQNWVRRSKLFCRWFCSLLGKRGAYPLLLESGERWLLIIWFRLVAWLFAARRRPHQPFAALGDGLRCFLLLRSLRVFAQVAGFHLDDCWPPLPL